MRTLQDLLPDIANLEDHEAIRWSSGFRTLASTYAELHGTIGAAINYFDELGIRKGDRVLIWAENPKLVEIVEDRKSTRLNSSHGYISYAVFCLKKKKN